MLEEELHARYQQAKALYHNKDYTEALGILDALDREFPQNHRVMYSRARCLARVGRYDEALEICGALDAESRDYRIAELKARIQAQKTAAQDSGAPELPVTQSSAEDLHPEGGGTPREGRRPTLVLVAVVAGLVVIAILGVAGVVTGAFGRGRAFPRLGGELTPTGRTAELKPPRWARIVLDGEFFPVRKGYWSSLEEAFEEASAQGLAAAGDARLSFGIDPGVPRKRFLAKYGEPDSITEKDGVTWHRFGHISFGFKEGDATYTDTSAPRRFFENGFRKTASANLGR